MTSTDEAPRQDDPLASDTAELPNSWERGKDVEIKLDVNDPTRQTALLALATSLRRKDGNDPIADFGRALLAYARSSTAQLFQDIFALYMTAFKRDGYFVEIGTGDGKLISNTFLLEKEFGWRGIVVEPNPVFLPALRENRDCIISTDCLLDVTGRTVTFEPAVDPEYSRIAPADLDAQEQDVAHGERRMRTEATLSLTTLSLNDLLSGSEAPSQIDFISVDVEGAEHHILKTFDFVRWSVGCFCIEHNDTALRIDLFELLTAQGYVRVLDHLSQWDDWYVHRSLLRAHAPFGSILKDDERGEGPAAATDFVHWSDKAIAKGDFAVARVLCERALELDPELGSAFRTLASLTEREGKPAQAIVHWRRALEIDPADYWAHIGLATLLNLWGERQEAERLLHAARDLRDDHGRAEALLQFVSRGPASVTRIDA